MNKTTFILLIVSILIFVGAIIYFLYIWWGLRKKDYVILIDKNNRWKLKRIALFDKTDISVSGKTYNLIAECGLLNTKGKVLYIFSENKPSPLKLTYNRQEWLSSETIMNLINNKYIQLLMKATQTGIKDMLLIYGAIGGILAGCSSILILLKTFGVI